LQTTRAIEDLPADQKRKLMHIVRSILGLTEYATAPRRLDEPQPRKSSKGYPAPGRNGISTLYGADWSG
jgi:hypothetical protein